MNKLSCCLVQISLLLVLNSYAQSGWERQSPNVIKDFTDVYFISPAEGWVVGRTGTILHTTDGGVHWEIQPGATDKFLQGIWFPTDSSGWIVASNGTMLYTHNKGQKWTVVTSPVEFDLIDIVFSDQDHGWIVGDIGLLMNTSDGGATWQFQYSGVLEPILSVCFTDPNNGWLAGTYSNGWLTHTINGGTDWRDFSQQVDYPTQSVFFISPYRGWVGGTGHILFTDDVGETFSERVLPEEPYPVVDLFFVDDSVGWALSEQYVYYSSDAGTTWEIQLGAPANDYFTALHFSDPLHGCVVGRKGLIYTTRDGGGTGVETVDISPHLMIYPNPSDGLITLRLKDVPPPQESFTIEIFDISGHLLYEGMHDLIVPCRINLGSFKGTATLHITGHRMKGSQLVIIP